MLWLVRDFVVFITYIDVWLDDQASTSKAVVDAISYLCSIKKF